MKTWMFSIMLASISFTGCTSQQQHTQDIPAEPDPLAEHDVAFTGPVRDWPQRVAHFRNGALEHESLYMQDPYEYYGGNDGQFKTGSRDDAWVTLASPGIFAWNFVTLPAAMIKAPPFRSQFSRSIYPVQQPVHALPTQTSREITDEQIQDYFENR
jgi:hypothetical protein